MIFLFFDEVVIGIGVNVVIVFLVVNGGDEWGVFVVGVVENVDVLVF